MIVHIVFDSSGVKYYMLQVSVMMASLLSRVKYVIIMLPTFAKTDYLIRASS